MSITRLQQARQMYAMGQRVAKTLDGSRPGYRGDDAYGGGSGNTGGGNNDGDRHNPHTASGTSKTSTQGPKSYDGPGNIHSDDPKAPPAYEIIGGTKYDVTPNTKKERELARVKQSILDAPLSNITKKGTQYYDPTTGTLLGFAPKQKQFGLLDLGLVLATGGLFGAKAKTAAQLFGTAKRTNNLIDTLSNTFGFENPIENMFSGNNKSTSKSKSTSKNNTTTNNGGDGNGDGIASLDNQASGYDEYVLLLQKLQSGNLSDSERNRFNVLKNMLGI